MEVLIQIQHRLNQVLTDYTYSFPNGRPYISLEDVSQVNRSGTAFTRLKNWVDSQISQGGGSSATQSVIMFHLTQEVKYINHAIQMVENHVSMAEIEINAGRRPAIANDSYLEIGWYLEQLSIVYDYAFERLTESQRSRWASYAELTLNNLWHPSQAQWGGVPHPWSGWSVTNPGNNYHYSFLRATQFWALAGQNPAWFTFLKSAKFPPLVSYYTHLSGGGSREGTGYGTAQKNLFELLRYWKSSTGEDLADYSTHAKDTIDYWIHATVPTMNRFVPVGDQSRVSQPEIYDYHEHLVQELIQITRGTDQARRGTWWLNHNSLPQMSSGSNFHNDLLPKLDEELAPTDLVYHAQGVGLLFARSSWNTDATWLSLVAGPYDESHAHQEQGSFTFYKNTWLVATSNIWSHSGIQQGVNAHNVVRFEKNNAVIPQNHAVSSMTHSEEGGVMTAVANLSPVYSRRSVDVSSWQRTLRFENNKLRVQDVCEVGVGVTPIFQLHVPVLPTVGADGVILAGNLKIEPQSEVTAQVVEMHAVDSDFNTGWRIELTALTGCGFTVDLTAL